MNKNDFYKSKGTELKDMVAQGLPDLPTVVGSRGGVVKSPGLRIG